jgi:hypothetical protein
MRSLFPLVALCALSSVPLRADMLDIKFLGTLSGSGTFLTDGTCSMCSPGAGLLSLTINIGPDNGTDAFDISDDVFGRFIPLYEPSPANSLVYTGTNSETNDSLDMEVNIWFLTRAGSQIGSGTYSVTPAAAVPESSSLLVIPVAALLGLRLRRWRQARSAVQVGALSG